MLSPGYRNAKMLSDKQNPISSHELKNALMLIEEFSKM
jgi:hypothetical protein